MSSTISRVLSLDDHLSWPAVASRLQRPTRKHDGPPYRSLFGLASDGVYMCPPCYQRGGELLPRLSTLTMPMHGGLFLLHWPGSHLHRTLSGILPCEARTFLTCSLSSEQPRSPVLLIKRIYPNRIPPPMNSRKMEFSGTLWGSIGRK